ncbi:hypothetical protein BSKO_07175 [Bryopsis sp. KO-2023]|nr:hypothetical protein BSKO_07175 [Bryopsis sp. KO-2023]
MQSRCLDVSTYSVKYGGGLQCRKYDRLRDVCVRRRKAELLLKPTTLIVCKARKSDEGDTTGFQFPWASARIEKSTSVAKNQDPEEDTEKWGIFDWGAYGEKWNVPWGGGTVALGMGAWVVAALVLGFAFIPQAVKSMGISSMSAMTQRDQAFILLETQVLETVVGLAIVFIAVRGWQTLPDDLFRYSLKEPFKKPRGWVIWAGIGILASLAANAGLSSLVSFAGYQEPTGPGTVDAVANMISVDFATYASLISVVGILAPLLEETVFRGFLLTSLTKWMPTPAAVVLSSVSFGLAHLSIKDFPYLTAVGMVWGFMYVRSRNLFTPMLMHCVWNSTVLSILFALVSAGVDLRQVL